MTEIECVRRFNECLCYLRTSNSILASAEVYENATFTFEDGILYINGYNSYISVETIESIRYEKSQSAPLGKILLFILTNKKRMELSIYIDGKSQIYNLYINVCTHYAENIHGYDEVLRYLKDKGEAVGVNE